MRSTRQLSVTLPHDMAEMVRTKVESGQYASESEVIRDGLRILRSRDQAVEHWLREQVAPAYDAIRADPRRAISNTDMRAALAAEHKRAKKAR